MRTDSGDYTSFEYLQIAVFLVGMPLAAILGAMLGLAGKWRGGRLLTAAIAGLGGAALVSVVLFITFLVVYLQMGTAYRGVMTEFFDSYFGQRVALLVLIATAAISLLAGIGLRRRPAANSAYSLSMRQLILLQLFPFIALGCWTGLRFFAINLSSEFARAKRTWTPRDWTISGDDVSGPSYMVHDMHGASADMELENAQFREAVRLPWLRHLDLYNLRYPDRLAIEELSNAPQLRTLLLGIPARVDLGPREIQAIGSLTALETLSIECQGKLAREVGPIANLPKLRRLQLFELALAPQTLQQLLANDQIRHLHLLHTRNPEPEAAIGWPAQLVELSIRQNSPLTRWRLDQIDRCQTLETLQVHQQLLRSEEVDAIARIENLRSLQLEGAIRQSDLAKLQALKNLKLLSIYEPGVPRLQEFKERILELALLPRLSQMHLDFEIVIEPEEYGLGGLNYPNMEVVERRKIELINQVNKTRAEKGLGGISISYSQWRFLPGLTSGSFEEADGESPEDVK